MGGPFSTIWPRFGANRFLLMPFFSSKRERQLWIATAVVVITIYSTLGLASSLVSVLPHEIFGVAFFLLGCTLVIATVITQGLRVRPGGTEVAVALGIVAAYVLILVRLSSPVERSHLVEYGVVAVLVLEALTERKKNGRDLKAVPALALGITFVIGVVDEILQLFIPVRVFDPIDILFNTIAALMAIAASSALTWARFRRKPA